jgi:hypothetical protein
VGFLAWTATSVFRPITTSGEIHIWRASLSGFGEDRASRAG